MKDGDLVIIVKYKPNFKRYLSEIYKLGSIWRIKEGYGWEVRNIVTNYRSSLSSDFTNYAVEFLPLCPALKILHGV